MSLPNKQHSNSDGVPVNEPTALWCPKCKADNWQFFVSSAGHVNGRGGVWICDGCEFDELAGVNCSNCGYQCEPDAAPYLAVIESFNVPADAVEPDIGVSE